MRNIPQQQELRGFFIEHFKIVCIWEALTRSRLQKYKMEEDLLEFWKQIALDSWENVSYAENVSLYIDYDYPSLELPPESQITLITLYTLTTTLALIGNVSVIIVLVFGHRSKTEIRKYLLNLAISDICMATFCIPFR